MDKYYLIKRDSRYYYFNNENIVRSPIHCFDADKIVMPNHKRDADGYLALGQYIYLHAEQRGRTVGCWLGETISDVIDEVVDFITDEEK